MPSLFDAVQIGSIKCANRIFMSPLTRARATKDHIPTPIMAEYYGQRAAAGLIISEATGISPEGMGWPSAPGIWSSEQVGAWKLVTETVHAKGGKIVCQLWHMGRMAHSNVTGTQIVAPSPIATSDPHVHTNDGTKPPEQPRELTKDDIKRIVSEYAVAAKNAIAAGFDGVQIHGANGYLIDEFLRDSSNKRTDEYGGSPQNRLRFLREVTESVVGTIGAERTGIRLSPNGDSSGTIDSAPETVFVPAAQLLNELGVAFLELREPGPDSSFGKTDQPRLHGPIREAYKGILVLNQEYDRQTALETVGSGVADAITFGRPFISNPDLVRRLKDDLPLNTKTDMSTWYLPNPKGYVDYPEYGN